jgi:hypothetical protein
VSVNLCLALGSRTLAKRLSVAAVFTSLVIIGCAHLPRDVATNPAANAQAEEGSFNSAILENSSRLFAEGRDIFRNDTFGSEAFWGGKLQLHRAIEGEKLGGVGPGLTAREALQAGLKVDVAKLPRILVEAIKGGSVSLEKPDTTVELLRADAVVGVKGIFDREKNLVAVGFTCAICHSTVDDTLAKGIGRRLDGWPKILTWARS